MYGRRGGGLPLIFLFFIFGGAFIEPLIYLGVTGLMCYGIYKAFETVIKAIVGSKDKKKVEKAKKEEAANVSKIDKKLKDYFHDNLRLYLTDEVCLMTSSGEYSSLGNLYLTFGNEKILKLSEFKNAYPDGYDRIVKLLNAFANQKESKKEKKDVDVVEENKERSRTKSAFKLTKAEEYIKQINDLNDVIPHEEISNGLDQTCLLLKQIDLALSSKKENAKLNKLYEYYLPILVNILNKYRELNDSPVRGEEFEECENQLMKTIILINQALKTLHSSIHEYEYMDLNADIETLQTILKKDGLVDANPFEGNDGK